MRFGRFSWLIAVVLAGAGLAAAEPPPATPVAAPATPVAAPVAGAPAATAADAPLPPPIAVESRPGPTGERKTTAGFRMEGEPVIETVFGDTARYRAYIDRFYAVQDEMRAVRASFYRNVQATIATLGGHRVERGRPTCPEDAVAPLYALAHAEGERYHELGADLEAQYTSIHALDTLGETAGLTPDYRWKVSRVQPSYQAALVDFREMRAAFSDQLASEIRYRKCNAARLLALGQVQADRGEPATPAEIPAPVPADPTPAGPGQPAVPAPLVTFFIDNTRCPGTVRIYLDDTLTGEVSARAKAAFQTRAGRHSLCLIPGSSPAECGDPGTLRSAQIHDGWAIAMRCD